MGTGIMRWAAVRIVRHPGLGRFLLELTSDPGNAGIT